jgi:phosphatidylglycerol---prolipoprotein diacylglyceryl transferase
MLPTLFSLPTPWGDRPVYAFGALLGLSLVVGLPIVRALAARQSGPGPELVSTAYLVAVVSGLCGARLLYRLENRALFAQAGRSWFAIGDGGMTAYGGFLGGLLGVTLYFTAKRQSMLSFADASVPALALGTALTRLGCYLYGCDFGTLLPGSAPAWLKWLGSFPRWRFGQGALDGSPAFLYHVDRYGLSHDATRSLPVHPTQLYESVAGLLLLVLAAWLWKRRTFSGQVFLGSALGYGVSRFLLEYLRDGPDRALRFGFSTAQLISMAVVPICALSYVALRGAGRRDSAR